jgi:ATP-dependent RNA helicase RhlE
MADQVFEQLQADFSDQISIVHSNKSQNYRLRAVQNFDTGKSRILIATDLIARGLDFKAVSHVINIDTPEDAENYIHRVGRTARANNKGVAITMVNCIECTEEALYLDQIESLMNRSIHELPLPTELLIETSLIDREIVQYKQKNATKETDYLKLSNGAFHQKKEKNTKVNRAQEKRLARKAEKFKSKRRKKK